MHEGPEVQAAERADIKVWNDNVLDMAKQLFARYNDVSTFVFDTHALFSEIIANPCSYAETCAYQNTDEWCPGCTYPCPHPNTGLMPACESRREM
jgi:hypothetical protein